MDISDFSTHSVNYVERPLKGIPPHIQYVSELVFYGQGGHQWP